MNYILKNFNNLDDIIKYVKRFSLPVKSRKTDLYDYQILTPTVKNSNSMTSRYGMESFPMHTDCAYYVNPPKWVILFCEQKIPLKESTLICDIWSEINKENLMELFKTSPFYLEEKITYILKNDIIRYDPNIMKPATRSSEKCIEFINNIVELNTTQMDFENFNTVIINNWKCLHARPKISSLNRTLFRVLGDYRVEF